MTAISSALTGVANATAIFNRTSHTLATSFQPGGKGDPVAAVVEQKQAQHSFNANLVTLKTAHDLEDRLLDILV